MKRLLVAVMAVVAVSGAAIAQDRTASSKPRGPSEAARFGASLAGAEFGGHKLPGVVNRDYTYPTPAELDYYLARGRTLVRLPFLWERLQRELQAPLDTEELERLRGVLRAAGQRKMLVILDPHSYGRYHFAGEQEAQIIGSERVPVEAFADFWAKLAEAVKGEPGLYAYALMNEPHDMGDAQRWPRAAQAAVTAIRQVDTRTTIIVPGDDWSSAKRWKTGPNRELNTNVRDAQNNLIFEAHCYFDKDGSGTYRKSYSEEGGSPDVGVSYVRPFVEWCKDKKVRGFVGEFGVPDTDTAWLVTLDRFLAYLKDNQIGGAYWAAGPWWGKHPMSIEPEGIGRSRPADAVDRPQMIVLRQYPG